MVSKHTQRLSEYFLGLTQAVRGVHEYGGAQNQKNVKDSGRIFEDFYKNGFPIACETTRSVSIKLKLYDTHTQDTLKLEPFTDPKFIASISYSKKRIKPSPTFGSNFQTNFLVPSLRCSTELKFSTITFIGTVNTNLRLNLSWVNVGRCCWGYRIFSVFHYFHSISRGL